jgi:hypothetical protein
MQIPPVVFGIVQTLPTIFLWPTAVFASAQLIHHTTGFSAPTWAVVAISIFAPFVAYILDSKLREHRNGRAAALNGVVLPPKVTGNEVSFTLQVLKSFKRSIPGKS